MSGALRVVPLGGLGEIGLNLLLLEHGDTAIAVDCGVMFPDEQMLGIDVVIPDFTYLRSLGERLGGIFLTHGHEDHIGALPYALAERDVPVFGTPLTLGFVRERLRERGMSATLTGYGSEPHRIGCFVVEPLTMTHSIPDTVGLAIRTPVGTVVHTGDFKLDQTPLDGRPSDIRRLAELGTEGVLLLLSDSTNAERPGVTPSERTVGGQLDAIFRQAPGRVLVTTFSSHIHRMQQVIDCATRFRRRVALVGRSLVTHVGVARELGLLHVPDGTIVDLGAAADLPRERVAYITAGSQAEPASALVRIAMDAHKQVKVAARRYRRAVVARDPGERARHLEPREPPPPPRRARPLRPHQRGPRVGARVAGGAQDGDEPRPPGALRAGARGVSPPGASHRARRRGRHPAPSLPPARGR
jgi:ribonuclease J